MLKVAKQPDGSYVLRWLDNRTIEVIFEGQISQALLEQLVKDLPAMTKERAASIVLFDAFSATGFSASGRTTASRFLAEFKKTGGKEVIAVVSNSALRMLGQTLTFAAGLPLKMVSSREQALTHIVARLREI